MIGEKQLLGCVAAQEPVCLVLSGGDLGAGGEVEVGLAGVAEPDAVPGADLVVGGQANGDGLRDAAACGASVAGGGDPDRAMRAGGTECRKRVGEADGIHAGEAGEGVQRFGGCGGEHVVLGAFVRVVALRGEPGRQDGEDFADGEVVGGGEAGQVGGQHLSSDGADLSWKHGGVGGCNAGGLGWILLAAVRRNWLRMARS